jgi:hypothetical protein
MYEELTRDGQGFKYRGDMMGYVMVWAWKEEFCDFGKVQSLMQSAIRAGSLRLAILRPAIIVICNLVIHAILELDGDRSADHSNQKYGGTHGSTFLFYNFLLPCVFFFLSISSCT